MEIKADTLKDKIYNIVENNRIEVFFGIFMVIGLSFGFYMDNKNKNEKILIKHQEILKEKKRIETLALTIKTKKPTIICKKQILFVNDYDLVQIKNKSYITTEEFVNRPFDGYKLSECSLYNRVTTSFKPKPIQTLEEKTKKRLAVLNTQLANKDIEISELSLNKDNIAKALDAANKDIGKLKAIINQQSSELEKLLIMEAKYKEIKTLLMVVLDKKNIKLKDLIIKPVPPKVKKIEVKKIIKKIKPHKVVEQVSSPIVIKDNSDRLKRIYFTINFLTKKFDGGKFKIVPKPSKKDLDNYKLSEHQIKNANNVVKQLKGVIDRIAKSKEVSYHLIKGTVRNSIKRNVGI